MTTVDELEVQERLTKLADHLVANGDLRSPEWRSAFLTVRRHVFVPRYWHDEEPGAFPARWRMVDRATKDHHEWLDAVYSNRTLATELSGVPAASGEGMHPQVTSSTTMPGLVIAMLEDLDVRDGHQVLEVGTGAGYNAALLCQRLGDTNVTSMDIDPELVAIAGVRLGQTQLPATPGHRRRIGRGTGPGTVRPDHCHLWSGPRPAAVDRADPRWWQDHGQPSRPIQQQRVHCRRICVAVCVGGRSPRVVRA